MFYITLYLFIYLFIFNNQFFIDAKLNTNLNNNINIIKTNNLIKSNDYSNILAKKIDNKKDSKLDNKIDNKTNNKLDNKINKSNDKPNVPWYTTIIPIYPNELFKFFSLSMMMFWIVFIFTISRDTKDTLIVTNCGAESIAFLKVYGVIPAATGFMILYSKLSNILSIRSLFYVTILPFFIFYMIFAFILYPLRNLIHPLQIPVPKGGLSYAVNLLRYWSFSLYYIVSELWGSAGIPLLFWSCANDIVKIDEAKRLYPLMALIGNLGPILSGVTMTVVSTKISKLISNDDKAFEVSLQVLTVLMAIAGGIVVTLHHFVRNHEERLESIIDSKIDSKIDKKSDKKEDNKKNSKVDNKNNKVETKINKNFNPIVKSEKPKLSLLESLQLLSKDRYLLNVATMVLSYGLTMEFTEIVWKATVKQAFPIKSDYLQFMGRYSTLVGVAAFIMMFVGTNIINNLGWQAGALMTPAMMGLLALPFFSCLIFGKEGLLNPIGARKPLLIAVYVGLVQNVLSKATKYAIFDPTKEMTYIPLDTNSKTKGKAAIDVLGARLGKSGGALAQQILVLLFGSIMNGAPVLAVLFYIVIFAWIVAVNDLAPIFREKAASKEKSNV